MRGESFYDYNHRSLEGLPFPSRPSPRTVVVIRARDGRPPGLLPFVLPVTFPEKFWSRVARSGECWTWTGRILDTGYGRLKHNCRQVRAHRVSWELANGPIPDGLCVLHRCDVRACVNPEHLFLGTYQDNNRDMHSKGRGLYKKLSLDAAKEIRTEVLRGAGVRATARRWKVAPITIRRVLREEIWREAA